jgi:hypothetical protein
MGKRQFIFAARMLHQDHVFAHTDRSARGALSRDNVVGGVCVSRISRKNNNAIRTTACKIESSAWQ